MSEYKYRINELLNHLPVREYKPALSAIPQQLGVSVATFNNYRAIKMDDSQDIPHEKVVMLEKIFSLEAGQLQNFTIVMNSISETIAIGEKAVRKYELKSVIL